jgi:hypothetical protein
MNNGAELEYSGFGNLVRDDKYDWCKGTISFPSLAACRILFSVWWDGEIYEDSNQSEATDSVSVMVFNKTDCIPSLAQSAAHLYLKQNQNAISAAVLQALNAYSISNIEEVRRTDPAILEQFNNADAKILEKFNNAIAKNQLDTIEGVKKQVKLIEIGFLEQEKNEHAYVSFDFNCGWDEEHGVSVLMHKNQVLAISGCADFYHRGEGLEAHVEILQSLT